MSNFTQQTYKGIEDCKVSNLWKQCIFYFWVFFLVLGLLYSCAFDIFSTLTCFLWILIIMIIISCQSNLTKGHIAVVNGRFNDIRHVAPICTHLNHISLGLPEQVWRLWQTDRQTDRQTDHATRFVTTGRIYGRITAMRPNNNNGKMTVATVIIYGHVLALSLSFSNRGTRVCVSVCLSVCPRLYAHTTARTRM